MKKKYFCNPEEIEAKSKAEVKQYSDKVVTQIIKPLVDFSESFQNFIGALKALYGVLSGQK